MRLQNKVALITGGTSAIGRASTRLFASEGAAVVICARDEEPGRQLVAEVSDAGRSAIFVQLDTMNQENWDHAVQATKKHLWRGAHLD